MKYFKRYMLTLRGRCRVILLGQFAFFLAILLSKTNLVFFQASSPDQEFDLHVKMLLLDDAYLTPDDSIESIETPGQKDPPSKSLVQQVFPYSVFVSASLSSAEDSSPLFPLPSVRAIAFFSPLDIYASWRRYLPRIKGLLLAWLACFESCHVILHRGLLP